MDNNQATAPRQRRPLAKEREMLAAKERQEKIMQTRDQMIGIYVHQFKRRCFIMLMRAFTRWCKVYPLTIKCDEVAKQLKERTFLLENIRGSYLRDVVLVKHHLEQIQAVKLLEENPAFEKVRADMYDLHAVPSVDLRGLIEKAKMAPSQASNQLVESLINANILDLETGKALNPWEQSRGYKRIQKFKRGDSYQLPDTGGQSMPLQAPRDCTLFIRHCSKCIGVISLVRNWSKDIEEALRYQLEAKSMVAELAELKRLVSNLQNIIENQQEDYKVLLEKSQQVETAGAWFDKWSYMKEFEEKELEQEEKRGVLRHRAEMANADKESTSYNQSLRVQSDIDDCAIRETNLKQLLKKEKVTREREEKNRLKLFDDVKAVQREVHEKNQEISRLNSLLADEKQAKHAVEMELHGLAHQNQALQDALDKKEGMFGSFREEMMSKICAYEEQLAVLQSDCGDKDDMLDHLRDEIRHIKATEAKALKDLAQMQKSSDELEERAARLQAIVRSKDRTRRTMKGVATMVLAACRWKRCLRKRDYLGLGYKRNRERLRFAERNFGLQEAEAVRLTKKVAELEDAYGGIEKALEVALAENARYKEELEFAVSGEADMRKRYLDAAAEISVLKKVNVDMRTLIDNNGGIAGLSAPKRNSGYNADDETTSMSAQQRKELVNSMTTSLRQSMLGAQMQRNVTHHVVDSLCMVRAAVHSLDMDSDMIHLGKSVESIMQVYISELDGSAAGGGGGSGGGGSGVVATAPDYGGSIKSGPSSSFSGRAAVVASSSSSILHRSGRQESISGSVAFSRAPSVVGMMGGGSVMLDGDSSTGGSFIMGARGASGKLSKEQLRAMKESERELKERISTVKAIAARKPVKLNLSAMFRNKGNKLINFIQKIRSSSKLKPFEFPVKFINEHDIDVIKMEVANELAALQGAAVIDADEEQNDHNNNNKANHATAGNNKNNAAAAATASAGKEAAVGDFSAVELTQKQKTDMAVARIAGSVCEAAFDDKAAEALQNKFLELRSEMRSNHISELNHVEKIREASMVEMKKLLDYVSVLKSKHNEVLHHLRQIVFQRAEDDLQKQLKSIEEATQPKGRTGKSKVAHVKSSISHLMHTDMQSYLSGVLSAIDTVQKEHGDVYCVASSLSPRGGGGGVVTPDPFVGSGGDVGRLSLSIVNPAAAAAATATSGTAAGTAARARGVGPINTAAGAAGGARSPLRRNPSAKGPVRGSSSSMQPIQEVDTRTHMDTSSTAADAVAGVPVATADSAATTTDEFRLLSVTQIEPTPIVQPPLGAPMPAQPLIQQQQNDEQQKQEPQKLLPLPTGSENGGNAAGTTTFVRPAALQSMIRSGTGAPTTDTAVIGRGGGGGGNNSAPGSARSSGSSSSATVGSEAQRGATDADGYADEDSIGAEVNNKGEVDDMQPPDTTTNSIGIALNIDTNFSVGRDNIDGIVQRDTLDVHIDEKEEEEEEESVDEELEELKHARMEALAFLERDTQLQREIEDCKVYETTLEDKIQVLDSTVRNTKAQLKVSRYDLNKAQKEVEKMKTEVAKVKRQNEMLRVIVEDGYRTHSTEVDSLVQKWKSEAEEKQAAETYKKLHPVEKTTQISCSVCSIEKHLTAYDELRNQEKYFAVTGLTPTQINTNLSAALDGATVLFARPRNINNQYANSMNALLSGTGESGGEGGTTAGASTSAPLLSLEDWERSAQGGQKGTATVGTIGGTRSSSSNGVVRASSGRAHQERQTVAAAAAAAAGSMSKTTTGYGDTYIATAMNNTRNRPHSAAAAVSSRARIDKDYNHGHSAATATALTTTTTTTHNRRSSPSNHRPRSASPPPLSPVYDSLVKNSNNNNNNNSGCFEGSGFEASGMGIEFSSQATGILMSYNDTHINNNNNNHSGSRCEVDDEAVAVSAAGGTAGAGTASSKFSVMKQIPPRSFSANNAAVRAEAAGGVGLGQHHHSSSPSRSTRDMALLSGTGGTNDMLSTSYGKGGGRGVDNILLSSSSPSYPVDASLAVSYNNVVTTSRINAATDSGAERAIFSGTGGVGPSAARDNVHKGLKPGPHIAARSLTNTAAFLQRQVTKEQSDVELADVAAASHYVRTMVEAAREEEERSAALTERTLGLRWDGTPVPHHTVQEHNTLSRSQQQQQQQQQQQKGPPTGKQQQQQLRPSSANVVGSERLDYHQRRALKPSEVLRLSDNGGGNRDDNSECASDGAGEDSTCGDQPHFTAAEGHVVAATASGAKGSSNSRNTGVLNNISSTSSPVLGYFNASVTAGASSVLSDGRPSKLSVQQQLLKHKQGLKDKQNHDLSHSHSHSHTQRYYSDDLSDDGSNRSLNLSVTDNNERVTAATARANKNLELSSEANSKSSSAGSKTHGIASSSFRGKAKR